MLKFQTKQAKMAYAALLENFRAQRQLLLGWQDLGNFLRLEEISFKSNIDLKKGSFFIKKLDAATARKDKRLSLAKRKELGLFALRDKKINFSQLMPLHELWQGYMRHIIKPDDLKNAGWNNSPTHPHFEQISTKLYRADFHGAYITVVKSKCPSFVGVSGIVAMETKNAYKIVSQNNRMKTVLKHICEFSFSLDGLKFTFHGHNFLIRPADRSNKKIKLIRPPKL